MQGKGESKLKDPCSASIPIVLHNKGIVNIMKNPNRYGTVAKLSGARRNPYIVRDGSKDRKVIGYAPTREAAMIMLADYNNEPWNIDLAKLTLGGLYDLWLKKRGSKLPLTTTRPLRSAYNHIKHLENVPYTEIKAFQMQECIDNCPKSYSTKNTIRSLWVHLDKLAMEMDLIKKPYSSLTECVPIIRPEKHVFTRDEINTLWEHKGDLWVDSALVLLYSGFRISELLNVEVDLENDLFKGGVKTAAGKNRIVPIHPSIRPIIESHPGLWHMTINAYRKHWDKMMKDLCMEHTPHECRHTFRSLLDSAGANKVCIDLLMGHKSSDVGERIYTHKTIEELRETVLKLS